MRFACWLNKTTDTCTEYVILIAFPRQQWLRQRASMLRYTCMSCLLLIILAVAVNWVFMHRLSFLGWVVPFPSNVSCWVVPDACSCPINGSFFGVSFTYMCLSFPINTSNFGFFLQDFLLILATALTPWSRALPVKLTRPKLIKKFPVFTEPEATLPHSQ